MAFFKKQFSYYSEYRNFMLDKFKGRLKTVIFRPWTDLLAVAFNEQSYICSSVISVFCRILGMSSPAVHRCGLQGKGLNRQKPASILLKGLPQSLAVSSIHVFYIGRTTGFHRREGPYWDSYIFTSPCCQSVSGKEIRRSP